MFELAPFVSLTRGSITETYTNSTTNTTTEVSHNTLFTDPGIGFEGRLGLNVAMFSFGAVGAINWESSRIKYLPTNQSIIKMDTYSNTHKRIFAGPTVILHVLKAVRVIGEYLPYVQDKLTYTKLRSSNPFTEGDRIKGSGWGAGIGVEAIQTYIDVVYRSFEYNKGTLRSVSTSLPNSKYSTFERSGVFVSFGISL
ncbi:MAG: hypothetical protein U0T83_01360 [Bacteriovoracaceae bacterium]